MCGPCTRTAWHAGLLIGIVLSGPALGVEPMQGQHKAADKPATPPTTATPSLSLADLEQMALVTNPTLAQAAAKIEVSRGRALQAGLYPNPTVGYQGEQIGAAGTAGELQGAFLQQEFVTAGKLRLSRAKYEQEIVQGEIQALAQQYRVRNAVRLHFWDVLVAQQLVEVRRNLLQVTEEAARTTKELVNVGAASRTDLLQAEVEAQRARAELRAAERRHQGSWVQLAAVVGRPDLCVSPLAGRLEVQGPPPDWDKTLCDLLQASPELQFAQAEVLRDQITLRREQVEAIPNITVRAGTGYNFESRNAVAEVQVGVRLPVFDRNQGTIRQAQAELARAQAEVTRVELSLCRRFADAAAHYQAAWESAEDFRTQSLPKARQVYELLLDAFRKRQAAWPQVLVAARTYYQFSVEYLEGLRDLRRAEVEIRGLLLVDGLTEPPGPTPRGHLDATPRPR